MLLPFKMLLNHAFWFVLFLILFRVSGQHPKCNFMKTVDKDQVNGTISVYSPFYPRYMKDLTCRWLVSAPEGFICRVDCDEFFAVPVRPHDQCAVDHLLVSRSGDARFESADLYCGHGAVSTTSFGQNITIGLVSNFKSRLHCKVTLVPSVDPDCMCGCKKLVGRIVGGTQTEDYEYPSMAGLVDTTTSTVVCGGVIIDTHHVLTSAHCVIGKQYKHLKVVAGERGLIDSQDQDEPAGLYKTSQVFVHPMYLEHNFDFDAALVRVERPFEFGDHLGPVCLPFKFVNSQYADMTGANLTVLGWGTIFPGGPQSSELLKTNVSIASWQACLQASTRHLTSRHICTHTPGQDACQGDSGGPLLYADPSSGLLFNLGIVSHGKFCASGVPAVNTRVTKILHWITRTTKAKYCWK